MTDEQDPMTAARAAMVAEIAREVVETRRWLGKAALDRITAEFASVELLAAIHQAVSVPLVIHGGTGFPEEAIAPAIARGVAKYNVGAALKGAFLTGLVEAVEALPSEASVHQVMGSRKEADVLQQGKGRMKEEVTRRIRLMRLNI